MPGHPLGRFALHRRACAPRAGSRRPAHPASARARWPRRRRAARRSAARPAASRPTSIRSSSVSAAASMSISASRARVAQLAARTEDRDGVEQRRCARVELSRPHHRPLGHPGRRQAASHVADAPRRPGASAASELRSQRVDHEGVAAARSWISSAASSAAADSDVFATRRAVPEALSGSSCNGRGGMAGDVQQQRRRPSRRDGRPR